MCAGKRRPRQTHNITDLGAVGLYSSEKTPCTYAVVSVIFTQDMHTGKAVNKYLGMIRSCLDGDRDGDGTNETVTQPICCTTSGTDS